MADSAELGGTSTGQRSSQKLSLGPLASDTFPKPEHFAVTPFTRPGAEVLSESIPVFFIGRNRDGFWVARDAEGKFGGLFWRKEGALRFARRHVGPVGCATVFPQDRFELDVENSGNPFVTQTAAAKRLIIHPATLWRFGRAALAIVLVAATLASIIALKAGIYLAHLNH
jgi:hypothetical protein